MKFTIEIQCDNDAFIENGMSEVARILKHVSKLAAEDGGSVDRHYSQKLYDINGNAVGVAKLVDTSNL